MVMVSLQPLKRSTKKSENMVCVVGVVLLLTATSLVRWACACFLAFPGVIGTLDEVDDWSGPSRKDCDEEVLLPLAVAAELTDAGG